MRQCQKRVSECRGRKTERDPFGIRRVVRLLAHAISSLCCASVLSTASSIVLSSARN